MKTLEEFLKTAEGKTLKLSMIPNHYGKTDVSLSATDDKGNLVALVNLRVKENTVQVWG